MYLCVYVCHCLHASIAFTCDLQTILTFLSIYFTGLLTVTAASIWNSVGFVLLGLALVGVATGGIKPTVIPFGASQFASGKADDVNKFVESFYFFASVATLISFVVIPIIR